MLNLLLRHFKGEGTAAEKADCEQLLNDLSPQQRATIQGNVERMAQAFNAGSQRATKIDQSLSSDPFARAALQKILGRDIPSRGGLARAKKAKDFHEQIRKAAGELKASGKDDRNIPSILAKKYVRSARQIREILKKK